MYLQPDCARPHPVRTTAVTVAQHGTSIFVHAVLGGVRSRAECPQREHWPGWMPQPLIDAGGPVQEEEAVLCVHANVMQIRHVPRS